jgi:hypothetical protein
MLAAIEAARPRNQQAATAALSGVKTKADLAQNQLFATVMRLMPRGIPHDIRDDAISEIIVGALSGDFDVADIGKHIERFVSRQIALWQSKYGPISLDAARFDDGNSNLHDTVSVGLWD